MYSFRAFTVLVSGLALLRVAIGTAAIGFSFAEFYRSSRFDVGAFPVSGRQYPATEGHFTLEAFNCQVRGLVETRVQSDLNRWCIEGVSDWSNCFVFEAFPTQSLTMHAL